MTDALTRGLSLRAGRSILLPVIVITSILLLWYWAKQADLLPITIPNPVDVWTTLLNQWDDLLYHTTSTVLSAFTGYVCAALVAAALGGIAVTWKRSGQPVLTFGIFVDSTPLIAVAPIFMLWLGNGMTLHVVVAGIASFFPLLVGMVQGFRSADRNMLELFHVLSASRWQTLTRLSLPSALPYIFSALKVAAPLALLGALIAEWMGTDRGLGTLITYALFSFNVPLVWLAILTVCALTAASYGLVAFAEHRFAVWSGMGTSGGRR